MRVVAAIGRCEGAVSQLGQLASKLNTSRASADNDEGQQALALSRIVGQLGALKRADDAGTDFECVVDVLHARSKLGKVIIAEVGLASASGNQEVVVFPLGSLVTQFRSHNLLFDVDVGDIALDNTNVLNTVEDCTSGRSDFARGQDARCYLVEQWLEQVVVSAVDESDVDLGALQLLRREQATETRTDDDHVRASGVRAVRSLGHVFSPHRL